MSIWKNRDYSRIDIPEINNALFYPRPDHGLISANEYMEPVMIPLTGGGMISSIWTILEKSTGSILFFHGNGELASEYVDIAELFRKLSIRFICVDYRGYGRSSGNPGIINMLNDAHDIFNYTLRRLGKKSEPLIVMGRSLGSASALEIAAAHSDEIDGLIIESGFAQTIPLIRTLGVEPGHLNITEEESIANIEKIKNYSKPLLIIHAENDFLIPIDQAEKLFTAASSKQKKLLRIPNAGHNDIFFAGMKNYLQAVIDLINTAAKEMP